MELRGSGSAATHASAAQLQHDVARGPAHPDCPPFRTDARINRCFDVQRQTLRKALQELIQNWSTARPTRSGCHSDVEHCAEPGIIRSLIAAEIRRAVQVAIARLH